jgi:hypothetical protein
MELSRAIFLGAIWSVQITGLVIGLKHWRSPLWFLIALSLVSDLATSYLRRVAHYPNFPVVGNINAIVEFLTVSFLYQRVVLRNIYVFYFSVFTVSILFVLATVSGSVWKFNTIGSSFFLLAYIAYSVIGFYKLIVKQQFVFLEKSRHFWTNVALLTYGAGSYLLFLFSDYLVKHDQLLFKQLWSTFYLSLNLVVSLLYTIAITKDEDGGRWNSIA